MIKLYIHFYLFLIFPWINGLDIGCRTKATILRQLEREGFHLDVHSFIELVVDVETAKKWENCSLILRENITDSFYVNPDQLLELNRLGISQACTSDVVNIEAPQHLSDAHVVYVYGQFKRSHNLIFTHLNFPLHVRYHKPKVHGGFSVAELKPPMLFISCPSVECKNILKSKAPCSLCGTEICFWMRFPFQINSNLTLPVPVGNLNHLWMVRPVTYLLTFGGCLYVGLTLIITKK